VSEMITTWLCILVAFANSLFLLELCQIVSLLFSPVKILGFLVAEFEFELE